jgi:hypothetical protein
MEKMGNTKTSTKAKGKIETGNNPFSLCYAFSRRKWLQLKKDNSDNSRKTILENSKWHKNLHTGPGILVQLPIKANLKEEGERELTGRCSRLGRQHQDKVVVGMGGSRSGRGWPRHQRVREVADGTSTSGGRQTWPSSVPPLAIHAPLPPVRGTAAPCWSSQSAGHQVDLRSFTAQPATTRAP